MSSITLNGDISGQAIIQAPSVAGTPTLTLPTVSGTIITTGTTQANLPANIAGNGPAFLVYPSSTQALTGATWTVLNMNTKVYDTATCFNTSTYRFTPNVAGYYQVNFSASYASNTGTSTNFVISAWKNGTEEYARGSGSPIATATSSYYISGSGLIYLNGTTDYIDARVYTASAITLQGTAQASSSFSAFLARGA